MRTSLLSVQFAAVLVIAVMLSGCKSSGGSGGESSADVVSGKVVSQPPPAGQAGIEKWRFQPDNCPTHYLRMTSATMQEAVSPESKEIKLDPWAGKKIKVKYQMVDEHWVWGAEVVGEAQGK